MNANSLISKFNPCDEAVEWLGDRDPESSWRDCPRSDWMLWLLGQLGGFDADLRVLARRFAAEVLYLWDAPEVVRHFLATGEGAEAAGAAARAETDAEVWAAARAARAAGAAACPATWAAGAAACPAAWAARAAWAAAEAEAAEAGAAEAGAAAARVMARQADQVREVIPWERVRDALTGRTRGTSDRPPA